MKRILLFVVLLALLSSLSCGLLTVPITPALFSTSTVKVNTQVSPTQDITLSTATNSSFSRYQKMCLNIQEAPVKDFSFTGKILLSTTEINRIDRKIYTLSQSNNNPSILIDEVYGDMIISPDGKWLAYNFLLDDQADQRMKSFKIISLDGKPEQEIHYGMTHYDLRDWLDNKRIVMYSYTKNLLVLDISTNQTDEIDITSPEYGIGTDGFGYQSVNPALDRMVYYRSLPVSEFPSAVLWDLENKREISRLDLRADLLWHNLSQWSPDGSSFAVAGPVEIFDNVLELFLVDQNGKIRQLTHIQEEAGLERGVIDHPTWSPDGRYIAFWLENSLAVFDTVAEKVIDYCLPSSNAMSSSPYWSLDSNQIVFNIDSSLSGPGPVIVVDINENRAVEVAGSQYYVEGWMIENP